MTGTEHEKPGCYTVDTVLRSCPPINPYVIRWEYPLFVRDGMANPNALKLKAGGRPALHRAEDVLKHLSPTGMTFMAWYRASSVVIGVSKPSFSRLVKELKDGGEIVENGGIYARGP
jgi:hypothetical protein